MFRVCCLLVVVDVCCFVFVVCCLLFVRVCCLFFVVSCLLSDFTVDVGAARMRRPPPPPK